MKIEVDKFCVNCKHSITEGKTLVFWFCKKEIEKIYKVTGDIRYKTCGECIDTCTSFEPTFLAKVRAFIKSLFKLHNEE